MSKNTGLELENDVYRIVSDLVKTNNFLLSPPYVQVHKKKSYYSKDRESNIICDVTVEKYWEDPETNPNIVPSIVVVIECKDYSSNIPVDDVEEFHSKLQQIGADNTKGIMITRYGNFQSGALRYATSKHISLARILPNDQLDFLIHMLTPNHFFSINNQRVNPQNIIKALTQNNYRSDNGQSFFSTTGDSSLKNTIKSLFE